MTKQLDLFRGKSNGRTLRDAGMDLVVSNERELWLAEAKGFAMQWVRMRDKPFLADEIKESWFRVCGKAPHHPNVWGAIVADLARKKLIRPTGVWRQSSSSANHAHAYKEWVRA